MGHSLTLVENSRGRLLRDTQHVHCPPRRGKTAWHSDVTNSNLATRCATDQIQQCNTKHHGHLQSCRSPATRRICSMMSFPNRADSHKRTFYRGRAQPHGTATSHTSCRHTVWIQPCNTVTPSEVDTANHSPAKLHGAATAPRSRFQYYRSRFPHDIRTTKWPVLRPQLRETTRTTSVVLLQTGQLPEAASHILHVYYQALHLLGPVLRSRATVWDTLLDTLVDTVVRLLFCGTLLRNTLVGNL